jgi:RNA polymerase sigma-70 factor (ECF subfamily)
MTDVQILDLYETRSESAIAETANRYGSYCTAIAMNILHNTQDAEEAVNDAYLAAWNAIPPEQPRIFAAFLGRITRNISLDRYKAQKAQKRGGNETDLLLSELEACIPSARSVENEVDENELSKTIDSFLASIGEDDAAYFFCRYWHCESVPQIARKFGAGESKVKMSLHRTRKKLKTYLNERGIET